MAITTTSVLFLFINIISGISSEIADSNGHNVIVSVFLSDPRPIKPDSYVSVVQALPADRTYYIVKFEPTTSMDIVHHLLVYGCREVISNNNNIHGEHYKNDESICIESTLFYAWARNAPPLQLPTDVGFKVGNHTNHRLVKIQVHFANPHDIDDETAKRIGILLHLTDIPKNKTAHTAILGTGGSIKAGTKEFFEVACPVPQKVQIHIFAFRPHTHVLGKVVSGYVVSKDTRANDTWTLIGKEDPQKPQKFYSAATDDIVASEGNIIAARCTMVNNLNRTVHIGMTSEDEMCNFYIMYWILDNSQVFDSCFSAGPPNYYWTSDPAINNIPATASSLNN